MPQLDEQKHKIIGPARIEGTQRGYVVWVRTDKRAKAQLTDATEDYSAARATAESIRRGAWTASRKGGSLHVRGRTLTVTTTR